MLLLRPLIRYADFTGRATRGEYWLFILSQGLVYLGCLVMAAASLGNHDMGAGLMGLLGWLAVIVVLILALGLPNYAVLARRLHDSGRSAIWMVLLVPNMASSFVSFRTMGSLATQAPTLGLGGSEALTQTALTQMGSLGAIAIVASICSMVLFVMTLMPGTRGPNRFGVDPRDPTATAEDQPSPYDDDRLEELFAQAKREARAAEGPYKPVFDFGPGPVPQSPAPAAPRPVDWGGTPAWDPGIAPARPFGRRT